MKLVLGLLLVVFNACLAGAESLTTLQDELKLLQDARQAIQGTANLSPADKLRKLLADETIKRLYNKYPVFPSATWENYAADLEKELKSVERKYKMPRYSPGADESMIEILEPTLAQLKKEYEGLGKKDAKRKDLKKRIDDLQSQLDTHKKLATVEKEKWENKSAKVAAERDAALTKIAEKVNGELDAFAELHYLMPIKKLKEREEQTRKEQVAKEKAMREAKRKLAESKEQYRKVEVAEDKTIAAQSQKTTMHVHQNSGTGANEEDDAYLLTTEEPQPLRAYSGVACELDGKTIVARHVTGMTCASFYKKNARPGNPYPEIRDSGMRVCFTCRAGQWTFLIIPEVLLHKKEYKNNFAKLMDVLKVNAGGTLETARSYFSDDGPFLLSTKCIISASGNQATFRIRTKEEWFLVLAAKEDAFGDI